MKLHAVFLIFSIRQDLLNAEIGPIHEKQLLRNMFCQDRKQWHNICMKDRHTKHLAAIAMALSNSQTLITFHFLVTLVVQIFMTEAFINAFYINSINILSSRNIDIFFGKCLACPFFLKLPKARRKVVTFEQAFLIEDK